MLRKSELQELARWGVRRKVEIMQRALAELFRAFPEEFAGDTPPVLLKPETKANGNDWPAFTATAPAEETNGNGNGNGHRDGRTAAGWTPARRARQAERARAVHAARKRAGKRKSGGTQATQWGQATWHRMHDYLATQDGRRAPIREVMKGIDSTVMPTVISAVKSHPDLFKRVGLGTYALKKVLTDEDKAKRLRD